MKCPACQHVLTEVKAGDIKVDVCQGGCGGVWFDNFELEKVDEQHEHAGESLLDVERDPKVKLRLDEKRPCPRCSGIKMMKHFFSLKRKVEVDECASCGGIWLDAGELRDIRGLYKTEKEREVAADQYFNEVFALATAEERKKSQESLAKAQKFARMFKFICPTYYVPGKQDWGAF